MADVCTLQTLLFFPISVINITRELLLGNTTLEMIKMENPDIKVGGAWEPNGCQSKWRVALIIPIRDREMHLKIFLRNIIPFLKNQKADFQIFAVEQVCLSLGFYQILRFHCVINQSHYRLYVPWTLEFGKMPVLRLPSKIRMQPCDAVAKCALLCTSCESLKMFNTTTSEFCAVDRHR